MMRHSKRAVGPVDIKKIANELLLEWKKSGKLRSYDGLNIADFGIVNVLTYSNGSQLLLFEEGDDALFERDFGEELNKQLFKKGIYVDVEIKTKW